MYATMRRLKLTPGAAAEVARLIETEYIPLLADVEGFSSYTLVDLGDDEISSLGLFTSVDSAQEANARARTWIAERLTPLVASPLEAREGAVLVAIA